MGVGYLRGNVEAKTQSLAIGRRFASEKRLEQAVQLFGGNCGSLVGNPKLQPTVRGSGTRLDRLAVRPVGQSVGEQIGKQAGNPQMIGCNGRQDVKIDVDLPIRM